MPRGPRTVWVDRDVWQSAVARDSEDGISLSSLSELWYRVRAEAPKGLLARLMAQAVVEGRPAHRLIVDALSRYLAEPGQQSAPPSGDDGADGA